MTAPAPKEENLAAVFKDGVKTAWPICLGYFPIGLAFGVIAGKAGLSPLDIGLMSVLVFAGSAQFIAVSMLTGGAGLIPVVMTAFVVNLRHLLMSSSLSVFLRDLGAWRTALYGYGVTDESFAVNLTKFRDESWDWRRALVVNHTSNAAWVGSTVIGGYAGELVPPGAFGLDYALIAMFLCLLVFQLRGPLYTAVAVVSGGVAVLFSLLFPGNFYIVAASVIAATLGLVFIRRRPGTPALQMGTEETKS
jgi:4-azaleucine resistance transporter AzlC